MYTLNDQQHNTQKTKDRATRTPLKTKGVNSGAVKYMAQKTTDRLTSVSLPSMLFLIIYSFTPNHVPTTNGTYIMYRLKMSRHDYS